MIRNKQKLSFVSVELYQTVICPSVDFIQISVYSILNCLFKESELYNNEVSSGKRRVNDSKLSAISSMYIKNII